MLELMTGFKLAGAELVLSITPANVDVVDDRQVQRAIERIAPDAVVNATGYNDVDRAEREPVDALNVNAMAVRATGLLPNRCTSRPPVALPIMAPSPPMAIAVP